VPIGNPIPRVLGENQSFAWVQFDQIRIRLLARWRLGSKKRTGPRPDRTLLFDYFYPVSRSTEGVEWFPFCTQAD
jgi:hypothetical protein